MLNAKVPRPWEEQVNDSVFADGVQEVQERGAASTGTPSAGRTPSSSGTTASTCGPRAPHALRPTDRWQPRRRRLGRLGAGDPSLTRGGAPCAKLGGPMRTLSPRSSPSWSSPSSSAASPSAPASPRSIPGTVEIATAHHYTVDEVKELRALVAAVDRLLGRRLRRWTRSASRTARPITRARRGPEAACQDAVIATEDRTFWTNDGIDLGAVFRAFLTNVTSGEIEQGGSTITQQLVKNRILTPKRDVNRKIREIEDALRLNEKFSKEKILEEYLNTVYFGSGSYGIKAAARGSSSRRIPVRLPRGKSLDELTIGEAALLAGRDLEPGGQQPVHLPRPRHPRDGPTCCARWSTRATSRRPRPTPRTTSRCPRSRRRRSSPPTTTSWRRCRTASSTTRGSGTPPKERRDKLLKGGLQDLHDVRSAPAAARRRRDAPTPSREPPAAPTGSRRWWRSIRPPARCKAMVGGPRTSPTSQYNIATHPPAARPGSTWKVITLAAALANGYSPNDSVDGIAPCPCRAQFPAVPPSSSRTTPTAAASGCTTSAPRPPGSVNCAFVRLSTSVGHDKVIDMAHEMGITQDALQPHPQPLDRHHRGHAARDGDGDGDHRQRRRAPHAVLGAEGGRRRRHGPVIDETNRAARRAGVRSADVADVRERTSSVAWSPAAPAAERRRRRPRRSSARPAPPTTRPTRGSSAARPADCSRPRCGSGTAPATSSAAPASVATRRGARCSETLHGRRARGPAPSIPLPDRGARAVQRARAAVVNQDGGHGAPVPAFQPQPQPQVTVHAPEPTRPPRPCPHRPRPRRTAARPPRPTDALPRHDDRRPGSSRCSTCRSTTARSTACSTGIETLPERDTVARRRSIAGVLAAPRPRVLAGSATSSRARRQRLDDEARALAAKAKEVEAKMYSGEVSLAARAAGDAGRRRAAPSAPAQRREPRARADGGSASRSTPTLVELDSDARRSAGEVDARPRARSRPPRRRSTRRCGVERAARDEIAGEPRRRARRPTTSAGGPGRKGVGVARLVGSTCQGCHLSIPSTEVEQIRSAAGGSVAYCDNCGCILVP